MSIQINQTYAQIGIDTVPSRLDIQSQRSRLELHSERTSLAMHIELPKVEIDQYQCFASAGLKNDLDRAKEISQNAYQQVMDFIAKTAQDGDALAAVERGGNPIAEIAKRDAYPVHEFGLDYIPKVGPSISLREGVVDIQAVNSGEPVNNSVSGNYVPGYVNIDYTPARINTYLKQYASVSIQYQGTKVDTFR